MANDSASPESRTSNESAPNSAEELPPLPPVDNFIRTTATVLLYWFNFDPFAIYKGTYHQATRQKYQALYLRPELRMPTDKMDTVRKWLRYWSLFCYFGVSFRFGVICIVQLAKYQATTYTTSSSSLSSAAASSSSSFNETNQFVEILIRYKIYYLFENALSEFPGVSLVMHLLMLASISYMVFYMPIYYNVKPMNGINLRIGLNPRQEKRRLDIQLGRKIDLFIVALGQYKFQLLASPIDKQSDACMIYKILPCPCDAAGRLRHSKQRRDRPHSDSSSRASPSHLVDVYAKRCSHILCNADDSYRRQHDLNGVNGADNSSYSAAAAKSLRSIRYSVAYYRYTWRVTTIFTSIIVPTMLMFEAAIQVYTVRRTFDKKCSILRQTGKLAPDEECLFLEAVGWTHIWSLFELTCVIYWLGFVLSTSIIITLVQLIGQRVLMREMRNDLCRLSRQLRLFNTHAEEQDTTTTVYSSGLPLLDRLPDTRRIHDLNDSLLKVLVRTQMALDEFRIQAVFISEMVGSFLFCFGSALILALTAGKMRGPDIEELRAVIVVFVWLGSNLMLIACANQYARFIKMESIGWSIVAQLFQKLDHDYHSLRLGYAVYRNPLVLGWLQLVEGENLADPKRNSIRPFGINLTFRRILELNFFVSSLAVLLANN